MEAWGVMGARPAEVLLLVLLSPDWLRSMSTLTAPSEQASAQREGWKVGRQHQTKDAALRFTKARAQMKNRYTSSAKREHGLTGTDDQVSWSSALPVPLGAITSVYQLTSADRWHHSCQATFASAPAQQQAELQSMPAQFHQELLT